MKKFRFLLIGLFSISAFASEADLKKQIEKLRDQQNAQEIELQKLKTQNATPPPPPPLPPVHEKSDTTIGGYGEIGYNKYLDDNSKNQIDMKRLVLFVGHRFSDKLTFNSEIEWEHAIASKDDQGETEIEQAYLNYQFQSNLALKSGLFLMPFGFINQNHEPPAFFGVERNEVESRIIPTTWREGGVGIYGTNAGIDWDFGLTTGLNIAGLDDIEAPMAGSHQELQLAKAHDVSAYLALNYRGVPGLTVGASYFTGNTTQGNAEFNRDNTAPDLGSLAGRVGLLDFHSRWEANGWDFQGLIAQGTFQDADKLDSILTAYNIANAGPGFEDKKMIPTEFYGWLLQAAYKVWQSGDASITPFVRYEGYDSQAKMPNNISKDSTTADHVVTAGLSFKPHPQVVFKADYQKFVKNTDNSRVNLGLGYMF